MRAKEKPRLRPPTPREAMALREFARSIRVNPGLIAARPLVLVVPGGGYSDVFDAPHWAGGVLEALGAAYSLGFHVGALKRLASGPVFEPSLPLAHRVARLCGLGPPCHVVDDFGERVFLYGREVWEEHIASTPGGFGVVVNRRGEALGWGIVKAKRGRLVLAPLSDLGWYLRRGG